MMSYAHKLTYAGEKPYQPERERDDITHEEYELLTQDETYQRLAEVRWLASELEADLATDDLANTMSDGHDGYAVDALFQAVAAGGDAPLQAMVERYVDAWLDQHRSEEADA